MQRYQKQNPVDWDLDAPEETDAQNTSPSPYETVLTPTPQQSSQTQPEQTQPIQSQPSLSQSSQNQPSQSPPSQSPPSQSPPVQSQPVKNPPQQNPQPQTPSPSSTPVQPPPPKSPEQPQYPQPSTQSSSPQPTPTPTPPSKPSSPTAPSSVSIPANPTPVPPRPQIPEFQYPVEPSYPPPSSDYFAEKCPEPRISPQNYTIDEYQQTLVKAFQPKFLEDIRREFYTITAIGSKHVYDIIGSNPDKIILVDFFNDYKRHEEIIGQLMKIIGDDKRWYDQVIYVDVNSDLKYEFYHLLYDVDILTKPSVSYPYFLVVKNGDGDIIRGEDSAKLIYDNLMKRITR